MQSFTNVTRMTGLSGIDTNDMIRQIMQAHSQRLHTTQRNMIFQTWRQESYWGVSRSLNTFNNRFLDVVTGPNSESIRMSGVLNGRTATVASGSIPGINVTANSSANIGNMTFSVLSPATNHSFSSNPLNSGITGSIPLNIANFGPNERFSIDLNGASVIIDVDTAAGTMTAFGGTTHSFTDNASFASALNDLLGAQFGNLSPLEHPLEPGPIQAVEASLGPGGQLIIDANGAGRVVTLSQGSPIPGLRTTSFTNFLDIDALTEWALGDEIVFAIQGGAGPIETLTLVPPVGFLDLSDDQLRSAFITSFNNAAAEAGFPSVTLSRGGAGNNYFSVVVANTTEDITVFSTTFPDANITALRNISLGVLGDFAYTTQNIFNTNSNLGEMLGAGFFTEGPLVGGDHAGAMYRSIVINGRTIVLRDNMTFAQMNLAINNAQAGVNMNFNSLTNVITLRAPDGAPSPTIIGNAAFDDFIAALGLVNEEAAVNAVVSVSTDGGAAVPIATPGNVFTIDGVVFDFRNVMGPFPSDIITVAVTANVDRARDVLVNFIYEYNALVNELSSLRNTSRPLSVTGGHFNPLLEHEKRAMTEGEVRMWEEQARIGTLHRSREIQDILTEMRSIMATNFPGVGPAGSSASIFSFGIQTNVDGTLFISDQDRFEYSLLNSNTEGLFTVVSSLGDRLNIAFRDFNRRIETVAGREGGGVLNRNANIERRISEYQDRADRLTRQLTRRENHLFARFGRMEQLLMQSNAQMDFLFSMMSGMGMN